MKNLLFTVALFSLNGCISKSSPIEYVWTDKNGYLVEDEMKLKESIYLCKYDVLEAGFDEEFKKFSKNPGKKPEFSLIEKGGEVSRARTCMNEAGYSRKEKRFVNNQPKGVVIEESLDRN